MLPDRKVMLGVALGALSATAIAAIGPGWVTKALADEFAGPAIDPSRLVRYENVAYLVDYDASVSADPVSTSRVKKIEAGKVSYVDITTTASGVYSSDAMFSGHVQYPGITVERAPYPHNTGGNRFSSWGSSGWTSFSTTPGHSYFYLMSAGTTISKVNDVLCVATRSYRVC